MNVVQLTARYSQQLPAIKFDRVPKLRRPMLENFLGREVRPPAVFDALIRHKPDRSHSTCLCTGELYFGCVRHGKPHLKFPGNQDTQCPRILLCSSELLLCRLWRSVLNCGIHHASSAYSPMTMLGFTLGTGYYTFSFGSQLGYPTKLRLHSHTCLSYTKGPRARPRHATRRYGCASPLPTVTNPFVAL